MPAVRAMSQDGRVGEPAVRAMSQDGRVGDACS